MKKVDLRKLLQGAVCISLCLMFILCEIPAAFADDSAVRQRTVRVAFPSQSGMSDVGESGDLVGYNYSYLQNLAEYAGWNVEYVTYDGMSADEGIMTAMQQVMSGEVDLLGPILRSDAVEEMFEFPENNYGIVYTTLCALEKSQLNSVNYTHRSPLRVAVYEKATTRNEEVVNYLEQLGVSYEIVECASTDDQIAALRDGRADLLSSITLSYFEGTRAVAQFAPRPYYFVSTKGNSELMAELDAAIEKINYTRPTLQDELQKEYFGDTSGGYTLTDEEAKYMFDMQKLDVLCVTNYKPYCSRTKDGKPTGVLVSLLNDFADNNDIEINYSFCDDAASLESEWDTGNYDCVIGLPFTPAYCIRRGLIRSTSVITTNMEIYGKSQNEAYENSTVAVYGEFTDQTNLNFFKEIVQYPSLEACFAAVSSGEADYGCANQLSVDYEIFSNAYPFVATPLLGEQVNIGIAVPIEMDSCFLSALNKYIGCLPENTVTAYLSEATRHEDIDPLALYVRSHPMNIAMLLAAVCVFVVMMAMILYTNTKRKRWNEELQEANKAMQKANEAKSEFLSRMSHDIRTPMNAILGFAKLGKQDVSSPEMLNEDLDRITSSGEFLLGLVNDILDISKIESNAMELKPQPYTEKEFKNQLCTLAGPLCAAKKIKFEIDFANNMPQCLYADKLRINQIFFNLLSNAVKFTKEGGHIEVTGSCPEEVNSVAHIICTVKDNGIGMSEEFQKRMFDSFAQEERHISTAQGTGLGLAIVKSLVEMMNGSITVESKLGEGSCFTVDLRLPTAPACEDAVETEELSCEYKLDGKKILLVEDHPVNSRLACRMLERVGIETVCAVNGREGVEKFSASAVDEFDAVLMDIRMPVMNGIEAAAAIRALDRADAKTIPIIAMTADAFEEDVQRCIDVGMNAHIAKPVNVKTLYGKLEQFCVTEKQDKN